MRLLNRLLVFVSRGTLIDLDSHFDEIEGIKEDHAYELSNIEKEKSLFDTIKNLRENTEPIERKQILDSANKIINEPALAYVINQLVNRLSEHSIRYAENWKSVSFDRATINGVELVKEEFEALEGEFVRMNTKDEGFNKQNIIN